MSNLVLLDEHLLNFYKSIKAEKEIDPLFRFSNEHIDFVRKFNGDSIDLNNPAGILIHFDDDTNNHEHHAFYISKKTIDHVTIGNSSTSELVSAWIVLDLLKRAGVKRSLDSVSSTVFSLRQNLSCEQKAVLLEFYLFFRLKKKSEASILQKLKSRDLNTLLLDFAKSGEECWQHRKKIKK